MPKLSEAGKKALDDLVAETVKDGRVPGFSLAITNLDGLIYTAAGGRTNIDDPSSPEANIDKSVYWLCSCTKILTSIAALQLVESGKLSLDTPVSKYFPVFSDAVVLENAFTDPNPKTHKVTTEVTVQHLMSHSSGLFYGLAPAPPGKEHVLFPPLTQRFPGDREAQYNQFFKTLQGNYPGIPLVFEPGAAFSYGYSTDVLGFVVEKVSGRTLQEYSDENIFKPLGVKTSFHLNAETLNNLVGLHYRNKDGSVESYKDRAPVLQRYPEPAGLDLGGVGAYSTLPDYLAILRNILQIYAGRDVPNAILKRSTVQDLFEPKLPEFGVATLTQFISMMDPDSAKDISHSHGWSVTTADWEGRRKKGSGTWSGWAGTWYFADSTSGLALACSSQVVPPLDKVTGEAARKAEEILYANLVD